MNPNPNLNLTGINKELPVALYYQLKESIRKKILSKEWKVGSKIPTETEICQACGLSRITVRKALEELQNEGYLHKIQGRGTFVQKNAIEQKLSKFYSFSDELKRKGLEEHAELIAFERMYAEGCLEKRLEVEPGAQVYSIERVRFIDDEAYAVEQSYIPLEFAPGLTGEMVRDNGLYKSLRSFGTYLDSAVEQFSARNLTAQEAHMLGAREGDAAISLRRITYSGIHVAEYCTSVVKGDFFSYTVELR